MELIEDYCYWCETSIKRPTELVRWLDEDNSAVCLFHPANFDARKMISTSETAEHQSMEEVHDIIIAEHHRRVALRAHKPLRAVEENVVIISKKAQRTSRSAAESILPKAGTIRSRVYAWFEGRKDFGATDDEAQEFLGIDGNTFRPTRKSLVDDGYIVDSGRTRKNANGHDCIVWIDKKLILDGALW